MLFERFISKERNEPPDIDVDFEHQRREEVMQYIYDKYGRDRAALTATVISYRARSAVRDVGKALGIDLQRIDQFTRNQQWWDGRTLREERLREAGFDPDCAGGTALDGDRHGADDFSAPPVPAHRRLRDRPRFAVAAGADRECGDGDRTVIQWDKDDLDALGLLKVDVLALGMLSAIRRALDLIAQASSARLPDPGRAGGGSGDLRHDLPRRYRRRVPDRIARADEHAAPAAAAASSTTW